LTKHGDILYSWISFAITALIARVAVNLRVEPVAAFALLTLRADWFIYRKPLDREVSQAWIIPLGGVVQKLMQAHSAQHRNAAAFSLHPGCLSGRTRSADQPPSITAPTMLLCPSRKPWRAVMLPSPPCESLCAWVHCGNQYHVGEKVTVPTERLSVTLPSSSGRRSTSRVYRLD
jgi:hypothetical protein